MQQKFSPLKLGPGFPGVGVGGWCQSTQDWRYPGHREEFRQKRTPLLCGISLVPCGDHPLPFLPAYKASVAKVALGCHLLCPKGKAMLEAVKQWWQGGLLAYHWCVPRPEVTCHWLCREIFHRTLWTVHLLKIIILFFYFPNILSFPWTKS